MDPLERARQLESQGQIGTAIDLLEQTIAAGEENPVLCKEIARMCLTIHERRAFANWCHEAIRLNPADGEPYLMMARELSAARRWLETVEALEQALQYCTLPANQTHEAQSLLAEARAHYAQWKRDHPGSSNL